MHLPSADSPADHVGQRRRDARRWRRALNIALGGVLVLVAVFAMQAQIDVRAWSVAPARLQGLVGLLTAPLLHGSVAHLGSNAIALLALGTLTIAQYPRSTGRTVPLAWLGSGLAAWTLGDAGSYHLGASGVTTGLMFMLLTLGLMRRDRGSIAAGMIAIMLFGGMLLSILPREAGVSWQSHLGGAVGGMLGALLWRHADPLPPRKRYSWEDEPEEEAGAS